MNPFHHPQCNDVLRRPAGTTEEECGDLHILREDGKVMSFWKPEPIELEALNQGGSVGLIVMGTTHPPLAVVTITPTPQDQKPSLAVRFNGLLDITKRAISLWTKNHLEDPDRRAITDELLDFLNGQPKPVEAPASETDIARWKSDAEGWKEEAERCRKQLAAIATAIGPDNMMPLPEAITAIKNRLAMAEAGRDTERELRQAAEANIDGLMHYLEGRDGHAPVSGKAVVIRDALVGMIDTLSDIRSKLEKTMRPNPHYPN